MEKYNFYYDESEHSRKINYKTITAENYYDNFITVIIGWDSQKEIEVYKRYAFFEEKYEDRKSHGELKSITIKQGQIENGFASLNKDNIYFLEDFLSLFDENTLIYFSVTSKIEYIIKQLFESYQNNIFEDMDAMKYSIVKALLMYRPKEIMGGFYENSDELIVLLKEFFNSKIEQNKSNINLKKKESGAFEQILILLDDIHTVKTIDWNYDMAFVGFNKYLSEKEIDNYSLIIDREGENGNTLKAAQRVGIGNATEEASINSCGIRMADMLAGLISKLLKALHSALRYSSSDEEVRKKLLDKCWFQISERQLNLYKKLYYVIATLHNAYYKSYSGIYSDDLILLASFLEFMNHFESAKEIDKNNLNMQGEFFNAFACKSLADYFEGMSNKLPIEPIGKKSGDYFINQRGAKVYFCVFKQPMLRIINEKSIYNVLSVGFSKVKVPLVTVEETGKIICYRLPLELLEWALTSVGLVNIGAKLFPAKIEFSKIKDKYYADIL